MKKLVLDVEALRVDSFEVQPSEDGAGTVFARATVGCPPACSQVCEYITQASCRTHHGCPPPCSQLCAYLTQESCGESYIACPQPCSLACGYETEASCTG